MGHDRRRLVTRFIQQKNFVPVLKVAQNTAMEYWYAVMCGQFLLTLFIEEIDIYTPEVDGVRTIQIYII